MIIRYICPSWGHGHLPPGELFRRIAEAGFDGVEINLPDPGPWVEAFLSELDTIRRQIPGFLFVAQAITSPFPGEEAAVFLERTKKNLKVLLSYQPDFINAHSGKDYYTFEENCRVLETGIQLSAETGIRILHETHRGRFSFHAPALIPYLRTFPELELVGDFSHFCVVSESMLEDQEPFLEEIVPRIGHLHARIGSEQAPQVSNPFAPEWGSHVERFWGWWKRVVDHRVSTGQTCLTITPEFGPVPYMPVTPFTQQPLGNQWEINLRMKDFLKTRLG